VSPRLIADSLEREPGAVFDQPFLSTPDWSRTRRCEVVLHIDGNAVIQERGTVGASAQATQQL
jgi:hypothetical protein